MAAVSPPMCKRFLIFRTTSRSPRRSPSSSFSSVQMRIILLKSSFSISFCSMVSFASVIVYSSSSLCGGRVYSTRRFHSFFNTTFSDPRCFLICQSNSASSIEAMYIIIVFLKQFSNRSLASFLHIVTMPLMQWYHAKHNLCFF